MSRPPNKPVTGPESSVPKRPGLRAGKKATPAPLPGWLCRTVSRLAEEFREKHGFQDHRTAERIGRLLKSSITSRKPRGRPVSPEVRHAAEMRQKGVPWPSIFQSLVPGYAVMDKYARLYSTQRLRENVRAYLKRRKRQRPEPEHDTGQGG